MTRNVLDFVALRLFAAGTRRSLRLAQREWRRAETPVQTFYRRLARETLRLIGEAEPRGR